MTIPHALRLRNFTLSAYIGRRFLALFLADFTVFSLIYVLADSLNQVDSFLKHSDDFWSLLVVGFTYYYHELPGLFCRILGPVITMASAMFTVTLTARANEFVPILATGTSLQRAVLPVVVLAGLIVVGSLAIQEVWIPGHRDEIRQAKTFGRRYGEIPHAYYVDSQNDVVVAAITYYPAQQRAEGVCITVRDDEQKRLYTARAAQWDGAGRRWILEDGEVQHYGPDGLIVPVPVEGAGKDGKPRTSLTQPFESLEFTRSSMIPQDLEGSESQDQYLSMSELRRKADVAPDRHRWLIKYYSRLVDPINHIVLLLLGVPVIFIRRTRNVFLSVLVAVIVATVYFVLQAIFVYLGNRRVLDPALAVWLAPMLFGALGTTGYFSMRT